MKKGKFFKEKSIFILLNFIFISTSAFSYQINKDIRHTYPYWFYCYIKDKEALFKDVEDFLKPDSIVIYKSKRKMLLLKNGILIRKFYVSLGRNPIGKKEKIWDGKTPEGLYYIDWRNRNSSYFLSLKISYPNFEDKINAYVKGYNPGNMIMIHGFPNWSFLYPKYQEVLKYVDWTNGCIAVSNEEMKQIWDLVDDFTPVIIKP
ncbi:MAG: L,D-transpeptidase family protein [Aquificae bacterium]|nr:L,D-transpeptidase family protein [Aquificota bacterium]